jgi:hypothetical protein
MTSMAAPANFRALRVALACWLTLLALAACSGEETPAVCSDADALKKSVSALTDVKVEQGALPDLQSKLTAVRDDLATLKNNAKSEFSSQLDAVDSASTTFTSALDAAVADPTVSTVSALGPPLQSLGTALTDLESAVEKTC